MQKNTDAEAAKKAAADSTAKSPLTEAGKQEAPAHPKKKNIIQVFRPQNSKTGMVKPGARPRPQGAKAPGSRPGGPRPGQGSRPAAPGQGTAKRPVPSQAPAGQHSPMTGETKPVEAASAGVKTAAPSGAQNASRPQNSRSQGAGRSQGTRQGSRPRAAEAREAAALKEEPAEAREPVREAVRKAAEAREAVPLREEAAEVRDPAQAIP